MIQIDDAGSGSFIGGTCIGVYRPETNEYFFDIIPVECYDKNNFKKKLYLDEAVNIVQHAFESMNVNKNEMIEFCRGYMFSKLKYWLDEKGYCYYATHINGRIQDVVEKNFELYTVRLGLPEVYIKYTKYPFHFHKLLRWVFSDYENRIGLCKVGWKCWQKMEGVELQEREMISENPHLYCLKCGKSIKKGSSVTVLSYKTGQLYDIYLHKECHNTQKKSP